MIYDPNGLFVMRRRSRTLVRKGPRLERAGSDDTWEKATSRLLRLSGTKLPKYTSWPSAPPVPRPREHGQDAEIALAIYGMDQPIERMRRDAVDIDGATVLEERPREWRG